MKASEPPTPKKVGKMKTGCSIMSDCKNKVYRGELAVDGAENHGRLNESRWLFTTLDFLPCDPETIFNSVDEI